MKLGILDFNFKICDKHDSLMWTNFEDMVLGYSSATFYHFNNLSHCQLRVFIEI